MHLRESRFIILSIIFFSPERIENIDSSYTFTRRQTRNMTRKTQRMEKRDLPVLRSKRCPFWRISVSWKTTICILDLLEDLRENKASKFNKFLILV